MPLKKCLKWGHKSIIQIVVPIIIYHEILNKFKSNLNIAIRELDAIKNKIMVLKNDEDLDLRTHRIMKTKTIDKFKTTMTDEFESAKVIIIPYSKLDIEPIFTAYFSNTFPFGSSDKKHEFPDAFALTLIEKWCSENKTNCTAISNDKDILNYKSIRIAKSESLSDFLDRKNKEIQESKNEMNVLFMIDETFTYEKDNIKSEIKSWVNTQLDDYSKYIEYANGFEIHDIDIEKIVIKIGDIRIISVKDTHATLAIESKIQYVVSIWIDDENYMFKDYDTKSWTFLEQREETIQGNREIDVELEYAYDENPNVAGNLKVSVLNNGNELKI